MNEPHAILYFLAAIAALIYNATLLGKAESKLRTLVKTIPTTLLAIAAMTLGFSWFLTAALALSAVGDAFLARKGQSRFILGLASFLMAHLAYSWLFWGLRDSAIPTWQILAAIALVVTIIVSVLKYLWTHLGEMKAPVAVYTAAIGLMAVTGFMTGITYPLLIGIGLFLISDIVLAIETFTFDEADTKRRITGKIIWACYIFGQAIILVTFFVPDRLPA